jgi:translation initiation factor 6
MIFSTSFDNCKEIGVFARLSNGYCLIGNGTSYNTYSLFDQELSKYMPVVQCAVADTGLLGRLTVGNKKGLLVPNTINDHELTLIRNSLPDSIKIRKIDDRLSALGNCIACNDHVALIHPEFERGKRRNHCRHPWSRDFQDQHCTKPTGRSQLCLQQ